MHPFSIVLILCAIYMFWYWYAKRTRGGPRPGVSPLLLLIHDGISWVLHDAKRDDAGNMRSDDGITYPAGTMVPVVNESSSRQLYVLAAEPLALANHATLEHARQNIVFGNIFKKGGDLLETMQLVASCLIICGALYAIMTVRGLGGSIDALRVEQAKQSEVLSKPLVSLPAAPAPAATVAP